MHNLALKHRQLVLQNRAFKQNCAHDSQMISILWRWNKEQKRNNVMQDGLDKADIATWNWRWFSIFNTTHLKQHVGRTSSEHRENWLLCCEDAWIYSEFLWCWFRFTKLFWERIENKIMNWDILRMMSKCWAPISGNCSHYLNHTKI